MDSIFIHDFIRNLIPFSLVFARVSGYRTAPSAIREAQSRRSSGERLRLVASAIV
jgi:hypothetical protein